MKNEQIWSLVASAYGNEKKEGDGVNPLVVSKKFIRGCISVHIIDATKKIPENNSRGIEKGV